MGHVTAYARLLCLSETEVKALDENELSCLEESSNFTSISLTRSLPLQADSLEDAARTHSLGHI